MEEGEGGKVGRFGPSHLRMPTSCGTSARGIQAEVRGCGDGKGELEVNNLLSFRRLKTSKAKGWSWSLSLLCFVLFSFP